MKSLISIPLTVDLQVLVSKGQKVKAGEALAKKKSTQHKEKIPLSKILSVKPAKITTYLRKKIGTPVKKGELLAKKDSIFKTIRIISPISGFLQSIDLKEGSLLILTQTTQESFEFTPIAGFIEGVNEDEITISFEGKVIEGDQGQGEQVVGESLSFNTNIDMSHFASEVFNKIVVAPSFTEGARAKLWALGAKGIISCEFYRDFPVVIKLRPVKLNDLITGSNKHLIMQGSSKRIIIPVTS